MFSEMLEISNTEGTSFATAPNVYKIYDRDHDTDIFEEVIDGLILEKYAEQDIKEYIKTLPSNKKRVAALISIGDDNVLWSKINEIIGEEKSGYQRLKSVYTLLKDYVKIADVNSKNFGEVLTPFKELAEPMVRLVEKYDTEFWKNKNNKVLDSSAGYGTFLILAAYKFMVGLKDEFNDEEERFKWVVENCLYYGELQARSVFSWLVAIDPNNEYKTNIYWGDFLSEDFNKHMKNIWNVSKFQLIIQNPPYNLGTKGGNGGRDLWDKFLIKSEKIVEKNGYLLLVHPPKWRKPESELFNIFKRNNLLYLEIHSKSDGLKVFKATTRYDFYLLQISEYKGKTDVIDELGKYNSIDIRKWEWLPNYNFDEFEKILSVNEKNEVIYSRSLYGNDKKWMSKEINEKNKFPCVYGMYKDGTFSKYYTSEKKGHFGIPKIIIPCAEKPYTIIDDNGEYGIMQNAFALNVSNIDDDLNLISDVISSIQFENKIIKSSKWLNFQIDYKMFKSFKKYFWREFLTFDIEKTKILEEYDKMKNIKCEFWKIKSPIIKILDNINSNKNIVTTYSCYNELKINEYMNYIHFKTNNQSNLNTFLNELRSNFNIDYEFINNLGNNWVNENNKEFVEKYKLSTYFNSNSYRNNTHIIRFKSDNLNDGELFWKEIEKKLSCL